MTALTGRKTCFDITFDSYQYLTVSTKFNTQEYVHATAKQIYEAFSTI